MGGINGFFISILQGIHSFVGNYGWSVVLFTLLIRFVLLPLDIKQRKSMRAMQKIQPMQMELQRKYGRDQEKYNKKLQELYRKENVKPLAGCLPMLISLPLLFIMFSAMRNLASEQSARMLLDLVQSMPALSDGTSVQAALSAIQIDLSALSITPEQVEAILQGLTLSADQAQAVRDLASVALSSDQISTLAGLLTSEQAVLVNEQLEMFLTSITLTAQQAQTVASGIEFESWLWIKNVFNPDSFMSSILPAARAVTEDNASILTSMQLTALGGSEVLTNENLQVIANFLKTPAYASIAQSMGADDFIRIPLNLLFFQPTLTLPTSFDALMSSANGLFILPLFAAVSQFFMTKLLTPRQKGEQALTPEQQQQANPMNGAFMKWFMPLLSLWWCAGYNAAFAIYWCAVNVIQIAQSFFINLYFERKDRKAAEAAQIAEK